MPELCKNHRKTFAYDGTEHAACPLCSVKVALDTGQIDVGRLETSLALLAWSQGERRQVDPNTAALGVSGAVGELCSTLYSQNGVAPDDLHLVRTQAVTNVLKSLALFCNATGISMQTSLESLVAEVNGNA